MTASTAHERVPPARTALAAAPVAHGPPDGLRWPETVTRLWHSRLSWSILATTAARLAQMVSQLVVSVIVSRTLGPAGRGVYATAGVLTALGTSFGNLGLPAANTYEVARERRHLAALLANSMAMIPAVGVAVVALLWLAGQWMPELLPGDRALLALALLGVPLGLALLLLQHLLIGLEHVRLLNLLTLTSAAVPLLAMAALWALGCITATTAFAVSTAVTGLTSLLAWRHLRRTAGAELRLSLPLLRSSLSYGLRAYFTTLAHALVLRVDLLMVRVWMGDAAVGQYSTAAALAEWTVLVPSVAAMLLFPRIAAGTSRREQWALCQRTVPIYLCLMSAVTLIAAVLARPAVSVLYGAAFLPSVSAFLWLLPGVFFRCASYPAYLFLSAIGRPISHLLLCFGVVAFNVLANAMLIPRYGFTGAAASSSASYLLGCAGGFWLARRYVRQPTPEETSA